MADGREWNVSASEVGVDGLRRVGGFLDTDFHPDLRGTKARSVFREMSLNDPVVGAILFAVTMLARQVEWTVQPVDDSEEAEKAAAFVEEVMEDMAHPWESFVCDALTMLVYGFAPIEIVWKRRNGFKAISPRDSSRYDDGRWGVRRLALRSQATIDEWRFEQTSDEVLGFIQTPDNFPARFVPIGKCMLFRTQTTSPEGISMLRTAYRPWHFKKHIEEMEGIGVERDLAGLPMVRVPMRLFSPTASTEEKATLAAYRTLAQKVRRDQHQGVTMPSDRDDKGNLFYELTLLSSGGSRQLDTTAIIDRYDRRIAMTVLADFIMLGSTAAGSFALSSDKTEMFATALGTFLKIVKEEVNRVLVGQLWIFNGLDEDVRPKIMHGDIEKQSLGELGAFITSLAGAGMPLFPDPDLENHLRGTAGFPLAPEDMAGGAPPNDPWPAYIDPTQKDEDQENGTV